MFLRVFACTLVFCLPAAADETKPVAALPAAWHGVWRGKMISTSAADKRTEVPVTFEIAPIKGSDTLKWVITYDGDKKLVKDYKLVPDGKKPGRFRIDEGNGVALDARLVGSVLYSHFDAGGLFLTARYELRDGILRFEVTSAKSVQKEGKVRNLPVEVVQTAELKKQ